MPREEYIKYRIVPAWNLNLITGNHHLHPNGGHLTKELAWILKITNVMKDKEN